MSEPTYIPLQEWSCTLCKKFGLIEEYRGPGTLEAVLRVAEAHQEISPACARQWGIGGLCVKDTESLGVVEEETEPEAQTGPLPVSEWGNACRRGFVRDSRFGSGQVIKGTNRTTTRKWRKLETK